MVRRPAPAFLTTHWSVVLTAGRPESSRAASALSRLCQAYWYPVYAYVRRRGHGPHDAQDLTQEFFARLLQHNWVAQADPAKGRFRTFLLSACSHFLANEWDKARAQKRGGQVQTVPLQLDSAEERYGREPADPLTPEQCYDRRWAMALLDEVMLRLKDEYQAQGKGALFEALSACLVGSRETLPYAELSVQLGVTEGTIKVAVHRLRQRYRQLLREEIANTLAEPAQVEDEMRHLMAALSS
jgi:RNA polymerase sigma-70 factor (ECF subfamily)